MNSATELLDQLAQSAFHRTAIDAVGTLALPDCWLAAGFVRNFVWDHLHAYSQPTALNDIDVIYFDHADIASTTEREIEASLSNQRGDVTWQVRNQARMHHRNGDAPYRSAADAMCHWAETPTATAVRQTGKSFELSVPFGTDDLFGLIVRPTPYIIDAGRMDIYQARIAEKDWRASWPQLTILGQDGPIEPPNFQGSAGR